LSFAQPASRTKPTRLRFCARDEAHAARGAELDILQALLFRFDGDELQEVLAVPGDPAAFDAFWG
jgi:hypothetical protein